MPELTNQNRASPSMSPVTQNPQTVTTIAPTNPNYSIPSTASVPATGASVVTIHESRRFLELSASMASTLRATNRRKQKRDHQNNNSELQRQSTQNEYFH
jgi:hypothetical protein